MRITKTQSAPGAGMRTSPWLILGAALILLIVVVVLALQNIQRDHRHMTEVLSARGVALIRAVEAGARTGMTGMMWGGNQVQRLLEESALLPEVLYIALISADGTVTAHSDPERIGRPLHPHLDALALSDDLEEQKIPLVLEDGRSAFEVLRPFRPLIPPRRGRSPGMEAMHRRRMLPDYAPWGDSAAQGDRFIAVGLDMQPLEEMVEGAVRHTIAMSAGLLLLGFAGFVSLFWMNSYRATRRSLQDTSAFADQVVTHLPVGLIATDRLGRIAFFNAAAEALFGAPGRQALGMTPQAVLPQPLCDLLTQLEQGQAINDREMNIDVHPDHSVPISVSATRIFNEAGQFVGHVLIVRDLGELRRLQAEVRRQEKLAALGGMAAGMAHEIRNPLSSIKGMATYFAGKFPADSPDREAARVMSREVDRLNRVISDLLAFARPSDVAPRRSDTNALIERSLQLVQQDAAAGGITMQTDLAADLCAAHVDPDRLAQCLLNLYLNAIQAMAPGGRLSVASVPAGKHRVRIDISDTGSGIAAADADKIFNPYFTTKPKGTGLGLAIVHKIIEAHGGRITFDSVPGQGTRFTITLPCADDVPSPSEAANE
ncbi:ATP-binding protein [Desulfatitalea alkaliphila]|uniref:Sensor histidine kinase ZraS n=1 Tax=Desulfatitalea alkaliphila TaxID=2929485 RepID=A0AA41R4J1_9BACT|nr:ATP-binding protein [Desulfatitalea alkaliphila]MCJ8502759.1 ATP-binding protein [Desulfatitalea alkaliphila]